MRPFYAFLVCVFLSASAFAFPTPTPTQHVYDNGRCFNGDQERITRLNERLSTYALLHPQSRIIVLCVQYLESGVAGHDANTFLETMHESGQRTLLFLTRTADPHGTSVVLITSPSSPPIQTETRTRILRAVNAAVRDHDPARGLELGVDELITIAPAPATVSTQVPHASIAPTPPTAAPQENGTPVGWIIAGIVLVLALIVLCLMYFPNGDILFSLLELLGDLLSSLFSSRD